MGTSIDHQNQDLVNTPFMTHNFLRNNAHLSVYDQSHLYIYQNAVRGWGSRRYDEIQEDVQF